MSEETKLLGCPCCSSDQVDFYEPEDYPHGWIAYCQECGLEARPNNGSETKEQVAKRWNRRAKVSAVAVPMPAGWTAEELKGVEALRDKNWIAALKAAGIEVRHG